MLNFVWVIVEIGRHANNFLNDTNICRSRRSGVMTPDRLLGIKVEPMFDDLYLWMLWGQIDLKLCGKHRLVFIN